MLSLFTWTSPSAHALVGDLRVSVVDGADDTNLVGAVVRVKRKDVLLTQSITGNDGTVTFAGLGAGPVTVECERVSYIRKPESRQAVLATKMTVLKVQLLSATGDAAYYKRAGARAETEAQSLPAAERAAFYEREWDRIKRLDAPYQQPMLYELKGAEKFLAFDPVFRDKFIRKQGN